MITILLDIFMFNTLLILIYSTEQFTLLTKDIIAVTYAIVYIFIFYVLAFKGYLFSTKN
jgi:hypothetical protein